MNVSLRYPVTVIIGKMTFEFPICADASLLVGVALLIAACSRPGSTAGSSTLKPIDQATLQTTVDTTAKELLIPGALVLLRTARRSEQARRPTVRVRHHPVALGSEHGLFSRRRDARLQLLHGLRPRQQNDARGLDQFDRIARPKGDGQCPHVKSARSDLRGVTAAALAVTD